MSKWLKFCSAGALVLLTGYSSVNAVQNSVKKTDGQSSVYPAMAVPLQPNVQDEVRIAKLNQMLLNPELTEANKAEVLYQRGRYYDNLGLRDLARMDFISSLRINPAQPDIFNLLGLYYTQIGEYDTAYQAFDSTLDLDPGNQQAVHNRAVALYYGGRYELAYEDMKMHFANQPDDPFRALWLYIIERELDETKALATLQSSYEKRTQEWGWVLAGIMLDEINEEEAVALVTQNTRNNTVMAQRLTEAYFYLGKHYKSEGDLEKALCVYKLAISFNVFDYVEHSYSFIELGQIHRQYKAAQKAGNTQDFVNVN